MKKSSYLAKYYKELTDEWRMIRLAKNLLLLLHLWHDTLFIISNTLFIKMLHTLNIGLMWGRLYKMNWE